MKTVKYIRVSTTEQNTARQENTEYKTYPDTCSGAIPFLDRPEGKKLFKACKAHKIACVRVHSIDRLGRNAFDIQDTINKMMSLDVEIFVEDINHSSKDKNGNPCSIFKMITDLLANVAQMERDSLKQRQKEGIAIAKKQGAYSKPRNRKRLTPQQLIDKNEPIVNCLKENMNLSLTARTIKKSLPTVRAVRDAMKELNQL